MLSNGNGIGNWKKADHFVIVFVTATIKDRPWAINT